MKFIAILLCLIFSFSCSDKSINSNEVSFNEAQLSQFIRFTLFWDSSERLINLTEFKEDPWPFHDSIVLTDSFSFDSNSHFPVSRSIYAFIPEEQVAENHIETFGIEFNSLFRLEDIDLMSNRLLSDENFVLNFLKAGYHNSELSNFGFHQTYIIAKGGGKEHSIFITTVEEIRDKENAILITGEFYGNLDYYGGTAGNIENGEFKLLLQN